MHSLLEKISLTLRLRRIGVRLALSYGLLLALFLIVILLLYGQINRMTRLEAQFANTEIGSLLEVQALSLSTESVSSALLQLLTATRAKRINEYTRVDEKNRRISALIIALKQKLSDQEQIDTLQRLELRRDNYQHMYIALVNLLEEEGQEAAKLSFSDDVQPALSALLEESNRLLLHEQKLIQDSQQQSQAALAHTALLAIVLSALALLAAALLAWLTTRSVVAPLAQLQSSALNIAAGDYHTKVPVTRTEEVNQVGLALNTMASAIAVREKEIEQLAYYDPLTTLPNRTFLLKHFGHTDMRHHALILMDLARLKSVNETLGFDSGDTVIAEVARRLAAIVSTHDLLRPAVLIKLAGGMFAVLFCARDHSSVNELQQRIDRSMDTPVRCGPHTIDINLVYGLAISGAVALSLLTLLRNTEVALYAAKHSMRQLTWYSDAQEASRLTHLSLVSDLRAAVKAAELQMWLQPKTTLADSRVYGFEALVRWQHPQRGFISPAEFIPFAERTGYISLITEWILENALRTLSEWKTSYPQLSIAINVSTQDLRDKQFPERVAARLQQAQIAPHLLRMEITESGIMEDPASAIELLQRLRATGIGISIDDFGTGYSSLAYLQKLPVNELKIDRSFVTDIDLHRHTQGLVKTIIDMGHGLGLSVIAEGIETPAERAILEQLGCDAMQGYLVSKPLYGQALTDWLAVHAAADAPFQPG